MDDRSVTGPAGQSGHAGWHADPLRRFEYRWFNGERWTADVSTGGRRLLDPSGVAPQAGPMGGPGWSAVPSRPSRTLAVLAFILGLGGAVIAWMPFLFVLGGGAAIAAIVLGIVALRGIAAGRAGGRGLAIAGLATGTLALGLCVVGVVLTGVVMREVREYTEPGPNEVIVGDCGTVGRRVQVTGTIENLDDRRHDYVIVVDLFDHGGRFDRRHITVRDVEPGDPVEWTSSEFVDDDIDDTSITCEVAHVNGPFPFGVTDA